MCCAVPCCVVCVVCVLCCAFLCFPFATRRVCYWLLAAPLQALDLGLNIGSWAMLALNRGCHVVAFDILSENVNRVVQTVARAKGEDGRLFLERFSAFQNGVKCVPRVCAPVCVPVCAPVCVPVCAPGFGLEHGCCL